MVSHIFACVDWACAPCVRYLGHEPPLILPNLTMVGAGGASSPGPATVPEGFAQFEAVEPVMLSPDRLRVVLPSGEDAPVDELPLASPRLLSPGQPKQHLEVYRRCSRVGKGPCLNYILRVCVGWGAKPLRCCCVGCCLAELLLASCCPACCACSDMFCTRPLWDPCRISSSCSVDCA